MEKTSVKVVDINTPIVAIGKNFTGDYSYSPQYVQEVQGDLTRNKIPFTPNKAIGVYYDNPEKTPATELKCFQGVFPENPSAKFGPPLTSLRLLGKYLHVKVSGPPMQAVYEGYNALFSYIQENGIVLKSSAGLQVSTFENNTLSIEIYMEII